VDLSLNDRVAVADRAKADLFVSLHFNSGLPNRRVGRLGTYLSDTHRNALEPGAHLRRRSETALPEHAFDEQNYQIAYRLHRELVQSLGLMDRGIRRARFMSVLRGQSRPAVLIEGGYLSNPVEATKIGTGSYRQSLAEAVARALE